MNSWKFIRLADGQRYGVRQGDLQGFFLQQCQCGLAWPDQTGPAEDPNNCDLMLALLGVKQQVSVGESLVCIFDKYLV